MLSPVSSLFRHTKDIILDHPKVILKYTLLTFAPALIIVPGVFILVLLSQRGGGLFLTLAATLLLILMIVASVLTQTTFTRVVFKLSNDGTLPASVREELHSAISVLGKTIWTSIYVAIFVGGPFILVAAVIVFPMLGGQMPNPFLATILFFYSFVHFILFGTRYVFATYLAAIGEGSQRQALKESSALTQGRWWGVFGRILLIFVLMYVVMIPFLLMSPTEGSGTLFDLLRIILSFAGQLAAGIAGTVALVCLFVDAKKTKTSPPEAETAT